MKIFDAPAPSPRRVRIYLAEKNIEIDYQPIDFAKQEHLSETFLNINPLGTLPVLELDNGQYLCETFAIMHYFEERYPNPPLMGDKGADRATVIMWDRRIEWELLRYVGDAYRHTSAFFKDRVKQVPEYAAQASKTATETLTWLNKELADRRYIAGDNFSIADITALVTIDLGSPSIFTIDENLPNLKRWYERVNQRNSSSA
jgi:glutathione S-transferase